MPKSIQERKRGEYVPLNENDIKQAVEVPVRQINYKDLIKVEKKGKNMGKKKKKKRKSKNSKDYTLIVSEKPQAANKIANSLGKPRQKKEEGVAYYELERDGEKIIVGCAVGHLYTLIGEEKGWPVFNLKWEPAHKKNKWAKKYYSVLKKLAKNAKNYILATDYDVEGEVIGWNILRFMGGKKGEKAKRMKFSTLTKQELEKSYKNLMKTIDWGQAIAGETRHYLDWFYGVNLSKALIASIKKAGKFRILSIGRVQGPALNLIVEKELTIQKFKPKPYWIIFLKLKNHDLKLKFRKKVWKKKELDKFKKLKGKKGKAETKKRKQEVKPRNPFDLTSLQRESYRLYKISPSQTLQIAQNLYLKGIISYPRTSSQKIPSSINPKKILNKLKKKFKEVKYVKRKRPVEGKKSDPAHPSIYPTGEFSKLSGQNKKIYDLIARRFISCFCENAKIERKRITFTINDLKFRARGLEIKKQGWMRVYPARMKQKQIEDINGEKKVEKIKIEEKETKPPKRFTPASIITELEKKNLGTKATRSNIVDILYKRKYVEGRKIKATPLGIHLISALKEHSPIILDEKLTRNFEKKMSEIQDKDKNLKKLEEKTVKQAEKTIKKISKDLKNNLEKIGKELAKATEKQYKREREKNTLNKCPKCKKGNLRILYNKKSRRYFLGCSNYPKCKNTYTLPKGLIKPAQDKDGKSKTCKHCGFPMLIRIKKGKRPWFFCFNPECESNKDWQKKKKKSNISKKGKNKGRKK